MHVISRDFFVKLRSDLMQTKKVLCFLCLEIQLNLISPFDRAIILHDITTFTVGFRDY